MEFAPPTPAPGRIHFPRKSPVLRTSRPARKPRLVAREAGLMTQLKGPHRVFERLSHLRVRRVDEDRAHVDALGRDHPAARALQDTSLVRRQLAALERLPGLVGPKARLFGPDAEKRHDLQSRRRGADRTEEVEGKGRGFL